MGKKMPPRIQLRDLINITNSVLGLAILAMPFCFAQAGLVLGSLTLVICALLTSYSCKLLLKSVELKKIHSLELLALRLFGHKGKVMLEIT
jgi:amino acid permease